MKPLAILPLDDRPVNYDYPQILARAAGLETLLPPREWLGNPWREPRRAELATWLEDTASRAGGLILAVDTLAYGGLIRMRVSSEPFETVRDRLEIIHRLKAQHPHLRILASSVIQRISRANSSEEEKPYWAIYGARMFRLSYLEHKSNLQAASPEETAERDRLKREIPIDIYEDFRAIRARNHAVNRLMLDWVEEGLLDYLLLPQDDTADYGWNIAEARALQGEIRARGLADRAITYPGADEIGSLLLAAWVCREQGFRPRVYPRYSSSSSQTVITAYEDRPMPELLKAHLAPLGGVLAETPDEAGIVLFVNAPALGQGVGEYQWLARHGLSALGPDPSPEMRSYYEQSARDPAFLATRLEMETPRRSPEEFTRAIVDSVTRGRVTALADVAFVNGADLILCEQLLRHPEAARLAAYGGWNTAGNTLGTVLAQSVIRALALKANPTPAQTAAHLEFLFTRFLDDYSYQTVERSRAMLEDLPALGLLPTEERLPDGLAGEVQTRAAARLQHQARELEQLFIQSGAVRSARVANIYLPWQRLFEVGFEVTVEPT